MHDIAQPCVDAPADLGEDSEPAMRAAVLPCMFDSERMQCSAGWCRQARCITQDPAGCSVFGVVQGPVSSLVATSGRGGCVSGVCGGPVLYRINVAKPFVTLRWDSVVVAVAANEVVEWRNDPSFVRTHRYVQARLRALMQRADGCGLRRWGCPYRLDSFSVVVGR
jgi:hypothetical protein